VDSAGNPIKGTIYSYALFPGQGNVFSFDPNDVPTRLTPQPTPGNRVTRTPIDWRYNCKAANGCPFAASTSPHIDNLRSAYGTAGTLPAGFNRWTAAGYKCATQSNDANIVVTGNWWVDCPNSKGFNVNSWITFQNGNVIFEGDVTIKGGGLCMNMDSTTCANRGAITQNNCPMVNPASDAFVYLRGGIFSKNAQSCLSMNHTMVYINTGSIAFGAGSGAITWTAPLAGNFQNLAMWSESSSQHQLGGQAYLNLEGCFFAPNAYPFLLSGQGTQFQTKAQFITYRLYIDGQGQVIMTADPTRSVPIPLEGVRLIR
jgi:hypothetical protein